MGIPVHDLGWSQALALLEQKLSSETLSVTLPRPRPAVRDNGRDGA